NYNGLEAMEATLTINKADPTPTLPSLTAPYGTLLSSVELPDGFVWQDQDPETTVGNGGTRTHVAIYTPEDTNNYNVIEIELAITVTRIDPPMPEPLVTYLVPNLRLSGTIYTSNAKTPRFPQGWTLHSSVSDTSILTAGTYNIKLTFSQTTNYNAVASYDTTVTVIVPDPGISLTNVAISRLTAAYPHTPILSSTLYGNANDCYAFATGVYNSYSGEKFTVKFKPKDAPDSDYIATDSNGRLLINNSSPPAGEYTLWVQVAATQYHTVGNLYYDFTIPRAALNSAYPQDSYTKYVDEIAAKMPYAFGTQNGAITWTYEYKLADQDDAAYSTALPAGVGIYTVRASHPETSNYEAESVTAELVIIKRDPNVHFTTDSYTAHIGRNWVFTPSTLAGSVTWTREYKPEGADDSEYTTTQPTEVGTYIMRVSHPETDTYQAGSATVIIYLVKQDTGLAFNHGDSREGILGDVWGSWINREVEAYLLFTYSSQYYGDIIIEYKPEGADDSAYTTDLPLAIGTYVERVTAVETEIYAGASIEGTVILTTGNVQPYVFYYEEYDQTFWLHTEVDSGASLAYESGYVWAYDGDLTGQDEPASPDAIYYFDSEDGVLLYFYPYWEYPSFLMLELHNGQLAPFSYGEIAYVAYFTEEDSATYFHQNTMLMTIKNGIHCAYCFYDYVDSFDGVAFNESYEAMDTWSVENGILTMSIEDWVVRFDVHEGTNVVTRHVGTTLYTYVFDDTHNELHINSVDDGWEAFCYLGGYTDMEPFSYMYPCWYDETVEGYFVSGIGSDGWSNDPTSMTIAFYVKNSQLRLYNNLSGFCYVLGVGYVYSFDGSDYHTSTCFLVNDCGCICMAYATLEEKDEFYTLAELDKYSVSLTWADADDVIDGTPTLYVFNDLGKFVLNGHEMIANIPGTVSYVGYDIENTVLFAQSNGNNVYGAIWGHFTEAECAHTNIFWQEDTWRLDDEEDLLLTGYGAFAIQQDGSLLFTMGEDIAICVEDSGNGNYCYTVFFQLADGKYRFFAEAYGNEADGSDWEDDEEIYVRGTYTFDADLKLAVTDDKYNSELTSYAIDNGVATQLPTLVLYMAQLKWKDDPADPLTYTTIYFLDSGEAYEFQADHPLTAADMFTLDPADAHNMAIWEDDGDHMEYNGYDWYLH
ncbi:MAG: hypothetical protein J5755_00105, partial [Clostridia bacterium]|nr:hypothetical protein [Clostridia bacterium]